MPHMPHCRYFEGSGEDCNCVNTVEKKKNEPDIALALSHHKLVNSSPFFWATLEINQFKYHRQVRLDIGTVNSSGIKESAIVSRYYQTINGEAHYVVQVHP